ncbi:MAG: nucleotidyltransferase [Muribaculaceae bacterium]|nr:nucleotidyltransferase [Muribaculaceae bacterium]
MKPTLFILAAGMGSRYGGLKQLDGVGPSGETIMDYSVYDAIKAGFGKIVFVIRHDFEAEFKEKVVSKYEGILPVEIVFQDINNIPEGFKINPERTKPWGTNHAVIMGKDVIKEPFAVINADDYYGRESFQLMGDFLRSVEGKKDCYCMIGFMVENTLSENGGVSRGLCEVDDNGYMTGVVECHGIQMKDGKLIRIEDDKEIEFQKGTPVSMNMWGFTPDYFDYSIESFVKFLQKNHDELKAEFYIPTVVNELIKDNKIKMKVLPTSAKWFGVTYAADRAATVAQFKKLVDDGVYPEKLF